MDDYNKEVVLISEKIVKIIKEVEKLLCKSKYIYSKNVRRQENIKYHIENWISLIKGVRPSNQIASF